MDSFLGTSLWDLAKVGLSLGPEEVRVGQQGKVWERLCLGGVLRGKRGPLTVSSAGPNHQRQKR